MGKNPIKNEERGLVKNIMLKALAFSLAIVLSQAYADEENMLILKNETPYDIALSFHGSDGAVHANQQKEFFISVFNAKNIGDYIKIKYRLGSRPNNKLRSWGR